MSFTDKQLFFIRVNKAAGTSIYFYLNNNKVPHFSHEIMRRSKDFIYESIKEPTYLFATMVRNPWARALSSYTFVSRWHYTKFSFEQFLQIPFDELKELEKPPYFVYEHCKPQIEYITDQNGKIDYLNHIGRVEKINDTCKWICKTFNIQENVPIEHRNSQRNKVIDYKSAYNEKTKKLVAKQYEIDIDTFKYTF
tara:strand:- start:411 stop:995 length:585 start_codon:yes stop_codon:yes gene_type:complete